MDLAGIARETICSGAVDRVIEFGDAIAVEALVVIVIRQRTRSRIKLGIYFLNLLGEVPRFAAAVRTGVRLVYMVHSVAGFASPADKRGAAFEHTARIHQFLPHTPVGAAPYGTQVRRRGEHPPRILQIVKIERIEIKRSQRGTAVEHKTHIRHIGGREIMHVDLLKTGAGTEHITHVRYIGGAEMADIKRLKRRTAVEHIPHICHIGGVEMTDINRLKRRTAVEHITHIRHFVGHKVLHALYLRQIRQFIMRFIRLGSSVEHVARRSKMRILH